VIAVADLSPQARPPAFVASVVAGAVALLFLALGAITGNHVVFGISIAGAVVSLLAALTWRSQLAAAWRTEHRPPRPPNPF
jgi:hypothetical protein